MIRVAVVGSGYFSQFHYDAWARMEDVQLVGASSLDRPSLEDKARAHGISALFDDAASMMDQTKPDLIDIVTPPETHETLVSLAATRGIRTICQKPLAPELDQAKRLVEPAESAGGTLVVHENFRFQPWFREIKRRVEGGDLGEIYAITFRLRPGDGQGASAYLDRQPYFQTMDRFLIHETGIHLIDVFRFIMGEVRAVTARLRRLNPHIRGEDAGYVIFEFESGASGLFDGNRLNDHQAENTRLTMGEMWVEGSDGVLRLDGDGGLHVRSHGGDETPVAYNWTKRGFAGDCVHALQRHVVDALTSGDMPVNTGRAYLPNIEIEEAIYRSHETGERQDLKDMTDG
ncbi:MAG: Gfo/Idh/MocA family protein [Geminicoccaceae bacterium]